MSNEPSPEQRDELAEMCNALTDSILAAVGGLPVGVVLGACMNVIHEAALRLAPADRAKLIARLRDKFVPDLEALPNDDPARTEAPVSGMVH